MKKRRWRRAAARIGQRPLAAVCAGLILFILLARLCGIPIFGRPKIPPELQERITAGWDTELAGTVWSRQKKPNSIRYVLKNCSFTFCEQTISLKKIQIISLHEEEPCRIGARVRFFGTLREIDGPRGPGQFDAREYNASLGIFY